MSFLHGAVGVSAVCDCGIYLVILTYFLTYYSKTCLKRPLEKKTKIGFQDRLSLNAGQTYCRMLQESILQYFRPSLSYHLPFKTYILSILEWPLKTSLTVPHYPSHPQVHKFLDPQLLSHILSSMHLPSGYWQMSVNMQY